MSVKRHGAADKRGIIMEKSNITTGCYCGNNNVTIWIEGMDLALGPHNTPEGKPCRDTWYRVS
jgi:hypothetical protein